MNSKGPRQFRLESFFEDEREVNVLVRSLARKLLKEKKLELPVSVLSSISGVSEQRWSQVYADGDTFLDDILMPVINLADQELELLISEERNFLDKIRHLLLIIYKINYLYPEVMILYQRVDLEGKKHQLLTREIISELKSRAFELLTDQILLEGIVKRAGTMEKLLLFLINQLFSTAQAQMFGYCEKYVEDRDISVFPDEELWVEDLLDPITDQLKGITAV